MAFAKVLPFLTLSVLCGNVLARDVGHVGKRQSVVNNNMVVVCHEEGWVAACPGAFACVPPGATCCSDGMSYAIGTEACPQGSGPIAGTGGPATSDQGAGSPPGGSPGGPPGDSPGGSPRVSPDGSVAGPAGGPPGDSPSDSSGGTAVDEAAPPAITPPPSLVPGLDLPSVDFLGFGANLYTFAMTYHFFSQYYSFGQGSSVLVSTVVTHCTIVSVSATDEAQASEFFSSFSATVVPAVPTEAPLPNQGPAGGVDNMAPPAVTSTAVPVPAATGPYYYGPENATVGTATRLPEPVVTAGAAKLGGAVAGMVVLVMGVAAVVV